MIFLHLLNVVVEEINAIIFISIIQFASFFNKALKLMPNFASVVEKDVNITNKGCIESKDSHDRNIFNIYKTKYFKFNKKKIWAMDWICEFMGSITALH